MFLYTNLAHLFGVNMMFLYKDLAHLFGMNMMFLYKDLLTPKKSARSMYQNIILTPKR
jgi:hypothetical protein